MTKIGKTEIISFAEKMIRGQKMENLREGRFVVPAVEVLAFAAPFMPQGLSLKLKDSKTLQIDAELPALTISTNITDLKVNAAGKRVTVSFRLDESMLAKLAKESALQFALNKKGIPFSKEHGIWTIDASVFAAPKIAEISGKFPQYANEIKAVLDCSRKEVRLENGNFVAEPRFEVSAARKADLMKMLDALLV